MKRKVKRLPSCPLAATRPEAASSFARALLNFLAVHFNLFYSIWFIHLDHSSCLVFRYSFISFFFFRLCVKWAKAGTGQGDSSIHLLPPERLRRPPNSSDDLCWHDGRRGRLLPGIHPTTSSLLIDLTKTQVYEEQHNRPPARNLQFQFKWAHIWCAI